MRLQKELPLRASGYSAQICHTTLFQNSVVNISVTLYNRLPERIKTLPDFKSFKKKTLNFYSWIILFIQLRNFCSFADLSIGDMSLCLM
jgi:hypothetical protein